MYYHGEFPYTLQNSAIGKGKGRPKGAGNRRQHRTKSATQRDSSQFEYVEQKMKKKNASQERKLNAEEDGKSKKVTIEEVEAVDFNESEDESSILHYESEYGSLLPKTYCAILPAINETSYDAIINIKANGFCDFITIAYQVFDYDQGLFINFKFTMGDHLITVQKKQAGGETIGIEKPYSCGEEHWFMAPKCAQLIACTSNRIVCVYCIGQASSHLPSMPPHSSKSSIAPIMMQGVKTSTSNKVNH
ncbi:hypothetical protein [Parasitella parasitica]|uniref:Uncharacterized protein n=1 Tax=Parasitella parasitica TaxID=35722 RepID=A0A0B7NIP1_9FUNG|nr:hypothetical protein [Parasitella parasitica]